MRDNEHDRIQRWVELSAPAAKVWRLIGGFDALHRWHPWVDKAELAEIEGEPHRHVKLVNGELWLDRLIERGDHHYTYATVEGAASLDDHRATLSCVAEPAGCRVFWSAYFVPNDPQADERVIGYYEAGLEALRERFDGRARAAPA